MPLIYFRHDETPLAGNKIYDEGDHWWGGAQLNFANIALTAALAVAASSALLAGSITRDVEELPAANLHGVAEESYWQNPVAPIPLTFAPLRQDAFDEQPPTLFGQYDEDFWQNPVAPIPLTFLPLRQEVFDEQFPTLYGQFDEDFWSPGPQRTPAQFYQPLPYWFDANEIVPQVAALSPDEDFWIPGLPWVQKSFNPLPFFYDTDEIFPAVVAFTPAEDYWQNFTVPVKARFLQLAYDANEDFSPTPVVVTVSMFSWIADDFG